MIHVDEGHLAGQIAQQLTGLLHGGVGDLAETPWRLEHFGEQILRVLKGYS